MEKAIFVNLALLWLSIPKNLNCPVTFDGSFLYQIMKKSVQWLRHMDRHDLHIWSSLLFCKESPKPIWK
jgi:hypothetical protein